jgi:kynureninase
VRRLGGWFGQKPEIQFDMGPVFDPVRDARRPQRAPLERVIAQAPGAAGFQISTPSAILTSSLLGALETMAKAGCDVRRLRAKSLRLTGYLEALLKALPHYVEPASAFDEADRRPRFTIITPAERGTQLSLLFLPAESGVMMAVFEALTAAGVIGDKRKPDVIRLSAVPMVSLRMRAVFVSV